MFTWEKTKFSIAQNQGNTFRPVKYILDHACPFNLTLILQLWNKKTSSSWKTHNSASVWITRQLFMEWRKKENGGRCSTKTEMMPIAGMLFLEIISFQAVLKLFEYSYYPPSALTLQIRARREGDRDSSPSSAGSGWDAAQSWRARFFWYRVRLFTCWCSSWTGCWLGWAPLGCLLSEETATRPKHILVSDVWTCCRAPLEAEGSTGEAQQESSGGESMPPTHK